MIIITNDNDYETALREVDTLWECMPGSKEEARLYELAEAMQSYDRRTNKEPKQ